MNFKIGSLTKSILIASVMVLFFGPVSFGRDGVKLYAKGNNSAWTSAATWSLTENGATAGLVPQNNDTLVISCSVVQNIDFAFSGNGVLEVSQAGLLRGDNQNLDFSGNSKFNCNGELKVNNLNFNGNSTLLIGNSGKVLVKSSFVSNSAFSHIVYGKLSVTGILSIGPSVKIAGNGAIESAQYVGAGSAFGISPASKIPDGSLITEINWIGSVNNNWNEPMNWAGKQVPASDANIAVLASLHNPEVTSKAYSNNLYVNSGSSLTIFPKAMMDVKGNLSVIGIGTLLLKNTIAEKSSLFLNGETSGKIKSEYPVLKGQKNLISPPVEMALSQTFLNMYLRTYDESLSQWGEYIVPTNDPLKVMQGYELYSLYSETRTFEGTPAYEPKSYSISNSGNGLNLTGNPFTSFIDWENNDNAAWERNSIASAIYYPDPSGSGNFSVYLPGGDDAISLNNGSRYIAPMQGFFVKASKQGSLTVNKSSRISSFSSSKSALKNNGVKFKLKDSSGLSDEVMFRVIDNASFGFDDKLDAVKIPGNTESSSLFMLSDDLTQYAINSIPSVNSSTDILLNIVCNKAGQFSISTTGALDFQYRYPVVLEDKELGSFTDLRADSVYSFFHSPEMNSNRFIIHFAEPNAISEQTVDPTEVAVSPGEVIIKGNENEVYTAILFTVDGKLVSTSKGTLSQGISLSTGNRAAGVFILKLSNGKQTITKKVFTK